jgi:RNA polymerase sigma factor (sigma-70 family)
VDRFSGLIWAVARGHGLRTADAEEVYQTAWFRLAQHIAQIKDPERVGAWLATTARRESLRLLRAAARTSVTSNADILDRAADDTPERRLVESEDATSEVERARQLWQAFQQLSERCRELLRMLIASPPPSYVDVAAALGMPIGSIGPTRARCLARLRELAADRGITSGTAHP